MKKIIRAIGIFFDKILITPTTRLVYALSSKFTRTSKVFENWLSKSSTLLFLSLFLAFIMFFVIDRKIVYFTESSAEVLTNQKINAVYNKEAYVIEGLPESVDITLIGSKADLYIAKQSTTNEVTVDLSDLKEGTHKVSIKYNQAISSIDYKVNPSVATVIVYPKVSSEKTLTVDILNKEKLDDKLVISDVKIANDKVVAKGADYKVKKVASVKALLDVKNIVKQEAGTITVKDIPLKAYDENGNALDVELVPSKIEAEVEITSPSKEVPIKVIPKGEVAFGKAISSIETSETKVKVYAPQDVLNNINFVPVEIDVNELNGNRQYKVELTKLVGVKSMSVTNINVNVKLGAATDRDIENVTIEPRNLGSEYTAQGLSEADTLITVNVKGVAEIIDNIKAEDITAYIDLKGYSEGEHEVEVFVEGNDAKVGYLPKTKKIRIKISKK